MLNKDKHGSPLFIEDSNLSLAWGRVVRHVHANPGREISPLVLSITEFGENDLPYEEKEIRKSLDGFLKDADKETIENVAFTIFPQVYWEMAKHDRQKLYKLYKRAFPRLRKMNGANRSGLYFQRLIMFSDHQDQKNEINQLETIVQKYGHEEKKNPQRMQLQASIFDPLRDHGPTAIRNFPCLQHVTFVPPASSPSSPASGTLTVNAFYATQQLFYKAYGNFLGLSHLGAFMAREMGLNLARLNIFVGIEKLDHIPKMGNAVSHIVKLVDEHRKDKP